VPAHDDVAIVQIAVILARIVDSLDTNANRMNQVQGLEGVKPVSWLTSNEFLQKFPLDQVAEQRGDFVALNGELLGMMVLNDDWTIAKSIELLRICAERPVLHVPLGKEDLRRPRNARSALDNGVDLTFPSRTKQFIYLVTTCQGTARLEQEGVDSRRTGVSHLLTPQPAVCLDARRAVCTNGS
jgi:hypothetical protein